MVGEKPDRMDDHGRCSPILQVPEVIENVGLEPGILGPAASALIHQGPATGGDAQVRGHQPTRFLKLHLVAGTPGHRQHDPQGFLDPGCRHLMQGIGQQGMPVPVPPVDRQADCMPP